MPETIKISTLLKQIVRPRIASDYAQFSEKLDNYKSVALDALQCFMKLENNGWTQDQRYFELDINLSLKDNLRNKVLLEFPCIFVCLPDGSAKEIKVLTIEDKNSVMSKRVWERIPTAHTFDAKVKLMQDAAKMFQSPRDRRSQETGNQRRKTVENPETVTDQSESTLKPLQRLIPNKKFRYNVEDSEKRRAEQRLAVENFKQQKIDAIRRLADELAGDGQWKKGVAVTVDVGGSAVPSNLVSGSALPSNLAAGFAVPSNVANGSAIPSRCVDGFAVPSKSTDGCALPSKFANPSNRVELSEITNSNPKPVENMVRPACKEPQSKNTASIADGSTSSKKSADRNRQQSIEIKLETDTQIADNFTLIADQAPKRTVKTAFFGTLGDSDLSAASDSDSDD